MPYTVAVSFDQFRQNVEVSGDHRTVATARKDRIVSLLEPAFEILDAFPTGSIPRFTAVREYADLDVMVVLHYGKHIKDRKPSQVLKSVQRQLAKYRTGVRRNGQAVTLSYETWPAVDIVPVSRVTNNDGSVAYYSVPDMNREVWLQSKPRLHDKHMTDNNKKCGDTFKRVVKIIKWWNYQHSHLLHSYHIEVLALKTFSDAMTDYPWDVFRFFDNASTLTGTSLWHEGNDVDSYLDRDKRKEVLTRLETAREKARAAWYKTYGKNDDHEGAIKIWRLVFGDKFPAYAS